MYDICKEFTRSTNNRVFLIDYNIYVVHIKNTIFTKLEGSVPERKTKLESKIFQKFVGRPRDTRKEALGSKLGRRNMRELNRQRRTFARNNRLRDRECEWSYIFRLYRGRLRPGRGEGKRGYHSGTKKVKIFALKPWKSFKGLIFPVSGKRGRLLSRFLAIFLVNFWF